MINDIVFHFKDSEVSVKLDPNEIEPLTTESWKYLYSENQKHYIPYYVLGATQVKHHQEKAKHFLYDGVQLRKHFVNCVNQKKTPSDPLTNLEIQDIAFTFFKCFEYRKNGMVECLMENGLQMSCFDTLRQDYLFVGLNHFTAQNSQLLPQQTKVQTLIGNSLLNQGSKEAAFNWLWCASQRGDSLAKFTLNEIKFK
jgi:hypothetical protein